MMKHKALLPLGIVIAFVFVCVHYVFAQSSYTVRRLTADDGLGSVIKFFFYPETHELPVYIDHEKMEKVVNNLLSNAFKFTKEGGEIILNLKAEEKQCSIIVKDTGIGIPIDQLEKIFDRFYQVDSSHTREHEGSGLGMALAKELVQLHHGTISVESLQGKGTTFSVRLPLGKEHLHKDEIIDQDDFKKSETVYEDLVAESIGEPETEKSTVTADDHQPVLLIVEDNADMRHYIGKIFSDHYKVIEAANGKEGITKAEEVHPRSYYQRRHDAGDGWI